MGVNFTGKKNQTGRGGGGLSGATQGMETNQTSSQSPVDAIATNRICILLADLKLTLLILFRQLRLLRLLGLLRLLRLLKLLRLF